MGGLFNFRSRFSKPTDRLWRKGERNRQYLSLIPAQLWPKWAQNQLNPESEQYAPPAVDRIFCNSQTRNWTTLSLSEVNVSALVDPWGLVVPHPESW